MRLLQFLFALTAAGRAAALYDETSVVKVLSAKEFNNLKNTDQLVVVEFFADWCGHCRAFAEDYETAATGYEGIVKFVAVRDEQAMGPEGVQGFPTIRAYFGKGKAPVTYNSHRSAGPLIDWVGTQLKEHAKKKAGIVSGTSSSSSSSSSSNPTPKGKAMVELDTSNFDARVMADSKAAWLVEFYAPWCGHCQQFASTYEKIAMKLKGKVMVAKVDGDANRELMQRFGIRGFPTIKLFPAGPKSDSSAIPYNGDRSLDSVVAFAMPHAVNLGDAGVTQLLSEKQFTDDCKEGVCILTFVPHILDSKAKGRKKYLSTLETVEGEMFDLPLKFMWLQGGDNFELEEQLNLGFGFPAVLAVNLEKGRYATHKGAFSVASIKEFVRGLATGRTALEPLPKARKEFVKADKWDGKDAAAPVADEL